MWSPANAVFSGTPRLFHRHGTYPIPTNRLLFCRTFSYVPMYVPSSPPPRPSQALPQNLSPPDPPNRTTTAYIPLPGLLSAQR
ncbi:hypothetical protein RSOLAG1IB_05464 [Rhizoctonia solani AG-1 IB]|uniref:Uncharacterized protein n=1 Tax=Thanatephorus cucumeris (strain AG1-IB / isolate 7/3/14) TaxID=1108050 RepID=A0A0B7G5C8_THACB|nr:hypothetical protein RSOLAG1IB_05464 [Rhizoctonia solani AG-1 IB]